MFVIAVGVAHVVLHVTDESVVPVGNVQRAVTAHLDVARAKVGVTRDDDGLHFAGGDVRAVVFELVRQHAEETDGVANEKVALVLRAKMRAAEDAAGGHGPHALLVKLLRRTHAAADVHVAAGAGRAVGGELKTPTVKGVAVRVRPDGEMKLDLEGARIETIHTTARGAESLRGRFHVRHVKHAARPVQPAAGPDSERVGGVMRVRAGNTLREPDAHVGLVVTVGVFQKEQLRRCCHEHATAPKLEAGDAV